MDLNQGNHGIRDVCDSVFELRVLALVDKAIASFAYFEHKLSFDNSLHWVWNMFIGSHGLDAIGLSEVLKIAGLASLR